MKIVINEQQFRTLIEQVTNEYDYYELMDNAVYEVFRAIRSKIKVEFIKINPAQFKKALDEYMEYKDVSRFPTNIILDWKDDVLYDVAMLRALTSIHGHTQHFPFDEFYDEFDFPDKKRDYDFGKAYQFLEKRNIDDYVPFFSNGQPVLSDYGLDPIERIVRELISQQKPGDILISINRILDVMHQRSDLSELFIEGGGGSLDFISHS